MEDGWQVTAQDINQWTKTNHRRAQETLPRLIRDLILASTKPILLDIPIGDSISTGGWDGHLIVYEGNIFVPAGESFWEFGTEQNINKKAKDDYHKRTTNPPQNADKRNSVFVFATSRTWKKRNEWEKEKNDDGQWARVKGINADNLAAWLEQCPEIHRWFARLIGKRPNGAWDIEEAWASWINATQPACNVDLALAGRQNEEKEIIDKLNETPSLIRIFGESENEAYAFSLATISRHKGFSSRLLVVKDSEAWDVLLDSQQQLIIIPEFRNPTNLGLAVQRGHWVILPSSKQLYKGQTGIMLSKGNNDQIISALVAMGLEKEKAEDVVRSCRGYLNPIRRHPLLNPLDYRKPDWATSKDAGPLLAALLVGAWDANNINDCEKVAMLSGTSYDKLEQYLQDLALADDTPIRRVGNVWQIVSRQDAWSILSLYINAGILDVFEKIVLEVLRELDPTFKLSLEERLMAQVRGKVTKHSLYLRNGLAEMLAMLGSYGDRDCRNIGMISVQDKVSWWIRQILMEDMSGHRWGSLEGRQLPLLAEASPEIFLESVEVGLKGDNPPIMELFVDEGDMGGCRYANLLWSLEGISWNLDLLARAARILAKLSSLYSGGSHSNHPSSSLIRIFHGLLPQTKANLDDRLCVIDSLITYERESGWKLLLSLLPEKGGGISTPIHRPEFREWNDGWKPGTTMDECYKHIVNIVERVLIYIDEEPNVRWPEFIGKIPQLPRECFNKALDKLRAKSIDDFSDEAVSKIYNDLKKIVSQNKRFSKADWALPMEAINQLETILIKFAPSDILKKHRFLFDEYYPDLLDIDWSQEREKRYEFIEQARQNALREIWDTLNTSGIEDLVIDAKVPVTAGFSLGNSSFTNDVEAMVLGWLSSNNESLNNAAKAYVGSRHRTDPSWIWRVRAQQESWSEKVWAAFCLGLPFDRTIFDFLETMPLETKRYYWENICYYYLIKEDYNYANFVLEQLIAYKRPLAAIDAAAHYLHMLSGKAELSSDLLAKVLELAAIEPNNGEIIPDLIGYSVSEIVKTLQSSNTIEHERMVRIEWMYLSVLRDEGQMPINLLKEITGDPHFFVKLICFIFNANPPIEGEFLDISPELRHQYAENSGHLLDLADQLPGQKGQEIDVNYLEKWINIVRKECSNKNRSELGDLYIGELLSRSPIGSDGVWPHESVRHIVELLENREIERGIETRLYCRRGAFFREGGKQERGLANKYREYANKLRHKWPRTAAMLINISEEFNHEGSLEDTWSQLMD